MEQALTETNFSFPGQTGVYKGKVRDVYTINNQLMVMVATDRISAFDVVLPRGIPFKGQLLNQLAAHFLDATADIVPNWKMDSPDPVVTIGKLCKPFPVEMIVRAYLSGSAWRTYKKAFVQFVVWPFRMASKNTNNCPIPLLPLQLNRRRDTMQILAARKL